MAATRQLSQHHCMPFLLPCLEEPSVWEVFANLSLTPAFLPLLLPCRWVCTLKVFSQQLILMGPE